MLVHLIRSCALITRKIIKKMIIIKNEVEKNFQFQNLSIFFKCKVNVTHTKNIISNKTQTWNDLINSCRIAERN